MFERPLRASHHCRHYSYEGGFSGGPRCAAGIDLSAPGAGKPCMPEPKSECSTRVEYTEAERAAWKTWTDQGLARMANALSAIPDDLPERSSGTVECPNCKGTLSYSRWRGGAGVECSTPNCTQASFNIKLGAKWPGRSK